jgi:hypothetical protein
MKLKLTQELNIALRSSIDAENFGGARSVTSLGISLGPDTVKKLVDAGYLRVDGALVYATPEGREASDRYEAQRARANARARARRRALRQH